MVLLGIQHHISGQITVNARNTALMDHSSRSRSISRLQSRLMPLAILYTPYYVCVTQTAYCRCWCLFLSIYAVAADGFCRCSVMSKLSCVQLCSSMLQMENTGVDSGNSTPLPPPFLPEFLTLKPSAPTTYRRVD